MKSSTPVPPNRSICRCLAIRTSRPDRSAHQSQPLPRRLYIANQSSPTVIQSTGDLLYVTYPLPVLTLGCTTQENQLLAGLFVTGLWATTDSMLHFFYFENQIEHIVMISVQWPGVPASVSVVILTIGCTLPPYCLLHVARSQAMARLKCWHITNSRQNKYIKRA